MKVLILAAGRGKRLKPLTDQTPKPLIKVGEQTLIERQINLLKDAGCREFVINLAHLGEHIKQHVGDGAQWDTHVVYSHEGPTALETGGGIVHALPLLGQEPFIVVNADIWTTFPYASLLRREIDLAHIVLVANPAHNPDGDFALEDQNASMSLKSRLTFAGIGVYRHELFADEKPGRFPLAPILRRAIDAGRVSAERFAEHHIDVGTPARLAEAKALASLS